MHIAAGLTVEWRSDRVYNSGIGTIFKRKGEFYEDYALQINMTLSAQNCENISAEGATVANVGADKQIRRRGGASGGKHGGDTDIDRADQ